MKRVFLAMLSVAALIVVAFFSLSAKAPPPETLSAVVKVKLPGGHGSGVSIGNGYVLTASHVVGTEKTVTLKLSDGSIQPATVMWSSKEYDIALLRTSPDRIGAARLECRVASEGETIISIGNPLALEFVSAYGKIAGSPREVGPWKSAYITDITTIMGQSGGPVFDADGDLIGITVGVMAAPMGLGGSFVGFGFVVPSQSVCSLLARH